MPGTVRTEAVRRGFRTAVLLSLVSAALNACTPYGVPSQRAIGDSLAPVPWAGLHFTTTDGATHALMWVRVARDTLFGIPAGIGGPEVGFALPDILRFDQIHPTPPRPYVTRGANALWFMPFVMMYAILNAYPHA